MGARHACSQHGTYRGDSSGESDADSAFKDFDGGAADAGNQFFAALRDFHFDVAGTTHFFALQGVSKLLETTALITRRLNRGLRVTGIVLCLYETGTRLAADITDDSDLADYRARDIAIVFQSGNLWPALSAGENIAAGSAGTLEGSLHDAWMHSDGHRANILAPGFTRVGVGVFCNTDGSIWLTEDFGHLSSSGPPETSSTTPPVDPIARPDSGTLHC